MGALYQRGNVWWVKYHVHGRPVYESSRSRRKGDARTLLQQREGAVATGAPIFPRADRIVYDEVAADLRQHYEVTGSRNLHEAGGRFLHLDRYFTGRRIARLGQADATDYAGRRQAEGAANSTINRELAVLLRMLKLAYEGGKLFRMPVIRKLKERGPREGFFEREQFLAVRRHLPDDLKVAVTIAYTYGWRMRSEVLTLERRHFDLGAGTLRLDPGMTKNDDGRVVYLTPQLKAMLAAHVERLDQLGRSLTPPRILATLFPHFVDHGGHAKPGTRRREFRKAWETACRRAGVGGRLRHDFRRTAVRNMVNAGVPERVAMTVTGHKTRAVFDRYHIVSPADLQEAARRIATATQER